MNFEWMCVKSWVDRDRPEQFATLHFTSPVFEGKVGLSLFSCTHECKYK